MSALCECVSYTVWLYSRLAVVLISVGVLMICCDYSNSKWNKLSLNDMRQVSPAEAEDSTRNNTGDLFTWSHQFNTWALKDTSTGHELNNRDHSCIWPGECDIKSDRIIDQLKLNRVSSKIFKIYPQDFSYSNGDSIFKEEQCLVDKCSITYDKDTADAFIYQNSDVPDEFVAIRKPEQTWIAYLLESPIHTFDSRFKRKNRGNNRFNWTASYRRDSDIVSPYSKFVPYEQELDEFARLKSTHSTQELNKVSLLSTTDEHRKIMAKKRGKVAWFVSNCHTSNSRLTYANELANYIQVDIYGRCGNHTCNKWNRESCLELLNDGYKFYLAFENSNCEDYITEKLFENAYGYNKPNYMVLPIVMGAPKEDYQDLAPPGSFIHVDDFETPKALALYLHHLDSNDHLYYSYFRWKSIGRFVDTKFLCRVCAMLHESHLNGLTKSYDNLAEWWTNNGDAKVRSCT